MSACVVLGTPHLCVPSLTAHQGAEYVIRKSGRKIVLATSSLLRRGYRRAFVTAVPYGFVSGDPLMRQRAGRSTPDAGWAIDM
jgi:hypothetical protein